MRVIVTQGVVKINEVELSKHHGSMELYIDVNQKYPKVSYSSIYGPGSYHSKLIEIRSHSGRGSISYVELIPEGSSEHRALSRSWFELVQVRYCVRYLITPKCRQNDKWVSLYNESK